MESACTSFTVTVNDQKSCNKIETLRGKSPTEIHIALREICGGTQWTVVRFPVRLLVFVKDVSPYAMTQDQERQKHQQMREV
jgi:hypothetical protein